VAKSAEEEIEFSFVSGDLTVSVPFLDAHRGRDGIEITVEFAQDAVTVEVSDIVSCKEIVGSSRSEARTAALAYLISKLLSDLKFDDHAERVADFCLQRGLVAPSRILACEASTALLRNPTSAVDLAMLNDLHQTSDWLALLFASILRASSNTYGHSADPVVRFYRAMIDADKSGQGKASLSYTLGNFFRSKGSYPSAVREYNAARKADPTYRERSYFQKELGGIFFMSQRYRCASKAYEKLVAIEDTPGARFLYGDALLYSDNPFAAKPVLAIAAQEASSTGAEAYLKAKLCEWLADNGISALNRPDLLAAREREQECGNAAGALWAHLGITFLLEDEVDCWADAIFLSLYRSDLYLEAMLLCAFKRCGVEPFLLMKMRRASILETDPSILAGLEEMAAIAIVKIRQEARYVPGLASGEIDHLYEQRGIIRMEHDPRF
jgi:tetratricopeptide (TPR) repeat protein